MPLTSLIEGDFSICTNTHYSLEPVKTELWEQILCQLSLPVKHQGAKYQNKTRFFSSEVRKERMDQDGHLSMSLDWLKRRTKHFWILCTFPNRVKRGSIQVQMSPTLVSYWLTGDLWLWQAISNNLSLKQENLALTDADLKDPLCC